MRRRDTLGLLGAAGGGLLLPGVGRSASARPGRPSGSSQSSPARPDVPAPADMSWWREARLACSSTGGR